jgi:hypothetical protein
MQLLLGHKHMLHTVQETELAVERSKEVWKDAQGGRCYPPSSLFRNNAWKSSVSRSMSRCRR